MDSNNSTNVDVNIIQWNCQSLRPKSVSLEALLSQEKIHFAVLCETWFDPESYFRMYSYNSFRLDRADAYGGVCILVHSSIRAVVCSTTCPNVGIELLHVKVLNCRHIENIISIYCPSTVYTTQNDWDYVFSLVGSKSLILGDFNAHHTNWSYKTDRRGTLIFDSMLDNNIIYLNNGEPTRVRFVNGTLQQSAPDISFVSSDLATLFSWKVTNETLGSDHRIIKLSITIDIQRQFISNRNFKKGDWQSYASFIEDRFTDFIIPPDPQEFYDFFELTLQLAANMSIPYTKVPQHVCDKFSPKPYWSAELSKAVAERRLALANLRRCPSPINLDILQEKTADAQRAIRQARSKSWQDFCSSIDVTTSSSDMWRKMRWIKGHRSTSTNRCVDKDRAEELLNSLTPDFACPPQPSFHSFNVKLESEITLQELLNSIKKRDTAPGCDAISFSMIKHLPLSGKHLLVKLYNICLFSGFVPTQWRDVKIIPIPKPGRDPNSSSALRPIALMSCICKIFHSILNKRLEWYLEKHLLFSDKMVGFRKSKSCYDNLVRLVSQIQIGFSKNLVTVACFIDIDNAYNNVDVTCLLHILDRLGVGSTLCTYLWSYLKHRKLNISFTGFSGTRITCRGLAQGDPLSPLLFNVATIDICKEIHNVEISQYADDFVLYVSKDNTTAAVLELELACETLSYLLNNLGLVISPTKSKFCVFKKGSFRGLLDLSICNVSIPMVNQVKYLGLWLDSSLKWGKHINETVLKVTKFVNLLKVLAGPGWGVHQKHLRRLYISVIRSRIDYASFLYDNSSKTNVLKLDRFQNQALRVIGGYIRSTPIHVMETELSLPPLSFRRKYLAGKFWLKSKSFLNNNTIDILHELALTNNSRFWNNKKMPLLTSIHNAFKSLPIHRSPQLEMYSLEIWVSNINLQDVIFDSIPSIDRAKRLYPCGELKFICSNFIEQEYRSWYKIFTDGSKDNLKGGAAFLVPYVNYYSKLKIDSDISIMHIELIAIEKALSYINSLNIDNIVILTDSKSALQHLARCTTHVRGSPVAYRILELIFKLQAFDRHIKLQWIPGHVQIKQNEEVDALARQAVVDGVPLTVLPLHSDYVKIVKKQCLVEWQEYFDLRSRERGIWFRTIQPQVSYYPWIDQAPYNRNRLKTALRLRSGHIPSNKFAFLMRKVPSPDCNECGTVEDVVHVLLECVRNEAVRAAWFDRKLLETGYVNSILSLPISDEAEILYNLTEVALKSRT